MSEKRKPLGQGPDKKRNGNIKNYLKTELNAIIVKFEKRGLGKLSISPKPEKDGNEYLFQAKKKDKEKFVLVATGKSPDQFHAKRKLFDKLACYLKNKKGCCPEEDKRSDLKKKRVKKEVEAKLFILQEDSLFLSQTGY